jgi:23S rRNA (guanosine2251-2'-O)-methyltransferase
MLKKSMDELGRLSKEEFKSTKKLPITVILEDIRSMHNVGSVFRTADAFLVEQILLCGFTPNPPHRDIHKTALGATETVEWKAYDNTASAIEVLKKDGYRIYAIEQVHNSIELQTFEISNQDKVAIIFGNEADGVNEETIAMTDGCIEIPQAGSKHSFNISVAAGIVLWEIFKKMNQQSRKK